MPNKRGRKPNHFETRRKEHYPPVKKSCGNVEIPKKTLAEVLTEYRARQNGERTEI